MTRACCLAITFLALALIACYPLVAVGQTEEKAANSREQAWIDLELGPETTVYEEPLRADGTVDYVAALNRALREGVTNDNNAFVLLLRVLPLKAWDPDHRRAMFEKLGLPQPTGDEPERFVPLATFLGAEPQGRRESESDREDQMSEAEIWGTPQAPNPDGDPRGDQAKDGRSTDADTPGGVPRADADGESLGVGDIWGGVEVSTPDPERLRDQALAGPWTRDDLPEVGKWIDANGAALAIVEEAVNRPGYWAPLVARSASSSLAEVLLPHLQGYLTLARVLRIRANNRLAGDDLQGAWHDIMTLKRLARLPAQEATTIAALVGNYLRRIPADMIRHISDHPHLTAKQALRMLDDLQKLEPMPHPRHAIRMDSLMSLDFFQTDFAAMEASERIAVLPPEIREAVPLARQIIFDINGALRRLNKLRREQLEIVEIDSVPQMAAAWDAFENTLEAELAQRAEHLKDRLKVLSPEEGLLEVRKQVTGGITDVLIATTAPGYKVVLLAHATIHMAQELETTALALMAYRAEHGNYPADLDALVPKYLSALPIDRFAEAPLHYELTDDAATLYSIGDDFEDNRGAADDDEEDLVVRLAR